MVSKMTIPAVSRKVCKLTTTCLFTLSCLILCFSCYDYANALSAKDLAKVSLQNILQSNHSRQQIRLDADISVQKQILQYMVWPNQRLKTQAVLMSLLQQHVSSSPYDSTELLSLLSLQAQTNDFMDEKLWTLQRSIKLAQWQDSLRPLLARYCILYRLSIQSALRQECGQVISELPWRSRPDYLAKLLGVDRSTLEQALSSAKEIE